MFVYTLTGIVGLVQTSMSASMPVESVVNTGVESFFEFGIVGAVMLCQIVYIFFLFKMHSKERHDLSKHHAKERVEWKDAILGQYKESRVIFDKQQDELLQVMQQVTHDLHEINKSILTLENTIKDVRRN